MELKLEMPFLTAFVCAFLIQLTTSVASAYTLATNNASLLWGPYRPNLYLGIRPRVPESLLLGLMWGKLGEGEQNLRHTCEQNDGLAGYGWTAYDTRHGGTQTINDTRNMVDLTTEFVKLYEGQSAGNWGLRIRGTPRKDAPDDLKTSMVFYVAMEAMPGCESCQLDISVVRKGQDHEPYVESVDIHTKHPILGVGTIHIPHSKSLERQERFSYTTKHVDTAVKTMNVTGDRFWQAKQLFLDLLKNREGEENGTRKTMIPDEPGNGNVHFVQLVFQGSFEFDILYSSHAATRRMTPIELSDELERTLNSFKPQFASVFGPKVPFNRDSHIQFGQSLFSNLLGGLGYFYGDTKVDESHAPEYEETVPEFWEKAAKARQRNKPQTKGPYELLTHVPSRSVFPRGFLWDEGFHLLPVLDWDIGLALKVVQSWLALMDADGWIAREQILGSEARSKVPDEFQVQYPHIANPPTLFLIVSRYLDILSGEKKYIGHDSVYISDAEVRKRTLLELYAKLRRHYEWFRKTQFGDVETHSIPMASQGEGYRWRGRQKQYNYASGLDDFPRAEPPDISELHVDALCWVGVMAETLEKLAKATAINQDVIEYQKHYKGIAQNLEVVHWSKNRSMYCDTRIWESAHTYTCPPGYVSLFPFMTGFLGPTHPNLNATLNLIYDPEELWTPHGVRSLSPTSTRYGTGDNYWRGPIWININYMIIERLLDLATKPGPLQERCRQIYKELRRNVVETVHKSWLETGYAWEQYGPHGGHGQRTQHFTGWTALVVKIMAFPDLEPEERFSGKIESMMEEAKDHQRFSAGAVMVAFMLVVFFCVYRRRFARLWRAIRYR
ncbi:glycoside hydrolase [Lojkania enalia]|uniref:Mannosyl-oligosaccharide glucosidase n=1 Tax=Lojkania enalia TaxID=147567 RepID=A0A9P4N9Q6_9PLEO|nr:glycoside hydrolase [Didymosphaeria enalia]